MQKYYVEFHGPEPMDEIGTSVEARDPDEAIGLAREKVKAGWNEPNHEGSDQTLGQGQPVYTFDTWTVERCVRMVE